MTKRPLAAFLICGEAMVCSSQQFYGHSRIWDMSIRVSTRMIESVVIVDIFGTLKLGQGTSKLRDIVQELLRDGHKKLLLNMAEVLHIDSSGIGELMTTYTSVQTAGGELKLLNLHKNVQNLLQVTRLYTIFDVQDDLTTAVRSYR